MVVAVTAFGGDDFDDEVGGAFDVGGFDDVQSVMCDEEQVRDGVVAGGKTLGDTVGEDFAGVRLFRQLGRDAEEPACDSGVWDGDG